MPHKRKNVDYQYTEFYTTMSLLFPYKLFKDVEIDELQNIINNNKDTIYVNNSDKYIDIFINEREHNKDKVWIRTIRRLKRKLTKKYGKIKKVFLCGKNYKKIKDKDFEQILKVNKELEQNNPNDSKKICKSDVYILFTNNTIVGISVKKCSNCPKSNYSIQKMFGELENKELSKKLNKNKNDFLNLNSITRKNYKNKRDLYNSLFVDDNNQYWKLIKENILKYDKKIIEHLICYLFCCNNKSYDVYELWDEDYTILKFDKPIEQLHVEFDTIKKHKSNASKLFYKIKYNNNEFINFEIRFKGNPFVSPQILVTNCNYQVLT
jgi:hypothetical protein